MKNISPKTIEEHRDYLYDIVKLKLFFLHHWLTEHPEEKFENVLRNRVDIYRKTSANRELLNPQHLYFDESPWIEMEQKAAELFQIYRNDAPTFEQEAFKVFQPSLDERLEKDYRDRSGLDGYQCGCLRHELKAQIINDQLTLGFHIANAIAPHSIFEAPQYLKNCLLDLCNKAEKEFQATAVSTRTWLNQLDNWLRYFPEEWIRNRQAPGTDVGWHYGFWGQFISARGTFNKKYGDYMRKTGKFPHYPCFSCCTIESLRDHLSKM